MNIYCYNKGTDERSEPLFTYHVNCPQCHQLLLENPPVVLQVTDSPHLREEVLSGQYFMHSCSTCQKGIFLPQRLVYLDAQRQFAVAWIPDRTSMSDGQFRQWNEFIHQELLMDIDHYQLRLTLEFEEFKEKIQLFEHAINDQLAEILKLLTDGVFINQFDEDIQARYFQEPIEGLTHLLYLTDQHQRLVSVPASLKTFTWREYEKRTANIAHNEWHRVNIHWATHLLEGLPGDYVTDSKTRKNQNS